MFDKALRCRFPFATFRCVCVSAALMSSGCYAVATKQSAIPQSGAPIAVYAQNATTSAAAATTTGADKHLSSEILYRILAAEFAIQRQLFSAAQESYLELAYGTHDPEIIHRALQISIAAKDLRHALEMARLLTQARPDELESHRLLAQLLLSAGPQHQDEALAELRWLLSAVEQQESSAAAFHAIGRLLSKISDKALAIDAMRRIVADHQDSAAAAFALAMLLSGDEDNWDAALTHYQSALALAPTDERIVTAYVSVLQRAERLDEALAVLTQHLAARPDASAVRIVYARTLILAKRPAQALEQLQRLLVEAPDNDEVSYMQGLLLVQLERLDEAEEVFKRLIYNPMRKYTVWYHLAQIYATQERVDDAIDAYQRIEGGQYRFNAKIQAALLLAAQDQLDSALEQLHQSEPHDVDQHVRVRRIEGYILTERELYDEAMQVYNQALARWPDSNKLLLDRAMLAEQLDDLEALERDLMVIIERDSEHIEALNSLGYTLADRTDRYAEALAYIERAYAIDPDSYYIVDSMGWVMYRLGRYTKALHFLRQALTLYSKENPDRPDPEIASHLGEVLWVTGNKEEARRIWDNALQHYPASAIILEVRKRLSGS